MHRSRLAAVAAAILILGAMPLAVLAAAPANDEPATATAIPSLPYTDIVDLSQSTDENPPFPACEAGARHRVWYAYTPAVAETISVSTAGDPSVEMALWTIGTNVTDLNLSGCAVDSGDLVVTLVAGTHYLISVGLWSFDPPLSGPVTFTHVDRPANDDVANAVHVDSASFSDTLPRTTALAATFEPGETAPSCRSDFPNARRSVWYRVTPAVDAVMQVGVTRLAWAGVYDGATYPGATEVGCTPENEGLSLSLTAGHTYLVQVGADFLNYTDDLNVFITLSIPPANDDFANAAPISSLPFNAQADLGNATLQSGEPGGCGYGGSLSVWYRLDAPANASLTIGLGGAYDAWAAVYTGSALSNLNQLVCAPGYASGATFKANAGTTYWIQIGRTYPDSLQLTIGPTPLPTAALSFSPSDPAAIDTITFFDYSFDPAGLGWTDAWTFGDGGVSSASNPNHEYARDGTYHVTLTITTTDGRTASTAADVVVQTHDVSIRKLTVPSSASAGQTKGITVGVVDTRLPEVVRVDLWVSTASGYAYVGSIQQAVAVRGANRTTDFVFSYTFSTADAKAGRVTFKAVATVLTARDAIPADNEATAQTRVSK